jgi:hypothetical protein
LPVVLDVTVETLDYTQLTLKVRAHQPFFFREFYVHRGTLLVGTF